MLSTISFKDLVSMVGVELREISAFHQCSPGVDPGVVDPGVGVICDLSLLTLHFA